MRLLQCALRVMHGGEEHPASAEDGCWKGPGREVDRREAGDEEAAKEMEEGGEKWTCCFSSEALRLKDEEQEEKEDDVLPPRSAAWSYQPGMVGERRHDRGVPLSLKEPSDLLWRMLRSMGVPGDEVVGDGFHSASALSTTVLDPSATMDETKAVASSSQLPTSVAGEGGATSWRRAVVAGGVWCAACMMSLGTVFGEGWRLGNVLRPFKHRTAERVSKTTRCTPK